MVHGCCQWVSTHNRFSNIISAAYMYCTPSPSNEQFGLLTWMVGRLRILLKRPILRVEQFLFFLFLILFEDILYIDVTGYTTHFWGYPLSPRTCMIKGVSRQPWHSWISQVDAKIENDPPHANVSNVLFWCSVVVHVTCIYIIFIYIDIQYIYIYTIDINIYI